MLSFLSLKILKIPAGAMMIKVNAPTLVYYFLRVGAIMKIDIYGQDKQFERVLKKLEKGKNSEVSLRFNKVGNILTTSKPLLGN